MIRAERLSSSKVDCVQEEKRIAQSLVRNGYPHHLIHRRQRRRPAPSDTPTDPPTVVIVIPYIRGLSDSIRRILSNLKIKTIFRPPTSLRGLLSHPKDPMPTLDSTIRNAPPN